MPRLTARWLRATATASSTRALVPGRSAMSPLMRLMSCRILLISCSEGAADVRVDSSALVAAASRSLGAQQVVEAGGQAGQEEALNAGRRRTDRVRERAARAGRASHCSQVISPLR